MSKTYLSADNSHGNEVTAASPTFAHIRGWDVGIRVTVNPEGTRLDVYLTTGSNNSGKDEFLGSAILRTAGPQWYPGTLLEIMRERER